MSDSNEDNGMFNFQEPFVLNEDEQASINKKGNLIDVNGWLLYVHEARLLRDWLNEVIP